LSISAEKRAEVLGYYSRAIEGHVHIRETLDVFLEAVASHIPDANARPTILELGSHAGVVTRWLFQRWPRISVVVCDDEPDMVEIARADLAGKRVQYVTELGAVTRRIDLAVSVARHHHLPHDYLPQLHSILPPGSLYVVADELCPEYCEAEHAERIAQAELIRVVGGYVLTTEQELRAFEQDGTIPEPARALEQLRRRALWRWYRYVVDEAVERGYFDIAVGELKSTHDDLITGSDAEHKLSPLIVERQFALAGFELLSKRMIGPANDPARQSMFVYELRRR
jgi:SAM-dependent methyltransferase